MNLSRILTAATASAVVGRRGTRPRRQRRRQCAER